MAIATREASATVTEALKAHVFDRVAEPLADDVNLQAGDKSLRILFLVSAHNGLSQRAWLALTELGHDVDIAVVGSADAMESAVREHDPSRRLSGSSMANNLSLQERRLLRWAPRGRARPLMTQSVRAIDWDVDSTDTIVRKIRAGEGHPGVLDAIRGTEFHLFGAHPEPMLRGQAGEIIARRTGAICRATVDGVVWITHLKRRDTAAARSFKLPAARALALAGIEPDVPEVSAPICACSDADDAYREIAYAERGAVGYLHFDFYNGAMSTEQCHGLREAYAYARSRGGTRVIVLMGGSDYFSNGIHLNLIEAAEDPAAESWRNLNAIDDLVRDIVETDSHLVISALGGDAGAGGVPLALAADYVVARDDVVLNPYYQHMGGLYGSEYWTYLLPRCVGPATTARLTGAPFRPVGTSEAVRTGLLDAAFGADLDEFRACTGRLAERIAHDGLYRARVLDKRRRRALDERVKPLQAYRAEELARCHECFFGPDDSYHEARRRFVYKLAEAGGGAPRLDTAMREPVVPNRSASRGCP